MANKLTMILLAALMASTLLGGCAKTPAEELVRQAQAAAATGDIKQALALSTTVLTEAENGGNVHATDLARTALTFIKISDMRQDDDGETMGLAVRAYDAAMVLAADSVTQYFANVDAEDTRHVTMLLNVVTGLEMPDSVLVNDEYEPYGLER